jgi:DNA-binding GntR family transcriptional regulator
MLAIRDDPNLSPMQKLVAFALATRMKPDGRCFPSQAKIAKDTGASRTTVKEALKGLAHREVGYLQRLGGLGRGNVTQYQATLLSQKKKGRETTTKRVASRPLSRKRS